MKEMEKRCGPQAQAEEAKLLLFKVMGILSYMTYQIDLYGIVIRLARVVFSFSKTTVTLSSTTTQIMLCGIQKQHFDIATILPFSLHNLYCKAS
jgi:hypothetical protein